jgi:hypothetical protein
MKGKLVNSYPKNGRSIYVFEVTGTEDELANYKLAKGEYHRENDAGVPLFFSPNVFSCTKKGDTIVLSMNEAGSVYVEDLMADIAKTKRIEAYQEKAIAQLTLGSIVAGMVGEQTPLDEGEL